MTLTNRLSLFFLTALALVLVSFTGAVYYLSAQMIDRHLADHLETSLDTLTASLEFHAEGAGWEADERRIHLGRSLWSDPPLWVICDQNNAILGQSPQPETARLWELCREQEFQDATQQVVWQTSDWLVGRRSYQAEAMDDDVRPANSKPGEERQRRLWFAVAVPRLPSQTVLRKLLTNLIAVSLAIFLLGLAASRMVCARALAPVRKMANAARSLQVAEAPISLPPVETRDELAELNLAFNGLLGRLHHAWLKQKHFTTDASHQLRTPLTALLGQVEVASRKPRNVEEYQSTLAAVHQQASLLRQIVESLLCLARESDENIQREVFDVSEWLTGHLATWRDHPRCMDVKLELPPDGVVNVCASTALLGQILDIIFDNACKYSPPGSPIVIALAAKNHTVEIRLRDGGYGIDERELPLLFTPFHRAEDARRRGIAGTGLGLSIAKRLSEGMGANLSLESTTSSGTSFLLSIPIDYAQNRRDSAQ